MTDEEISKLLDKVTTATAIASYCSPLEIGAGVRIDHPAQLIDLAACILSNMRVEAFNRRDFRVFRVLDNALLSMGISDAQQTSSSSKLVYKK